MKKKKTLIIEHHGQRLELNSINPEIDQAFIDIYKSFMDEPSINLENLRIESLAYFDSLDSHPIVAADFINNFTILWLAFASRRLWDQAEEIWEFVLELIRKWESENVGRRIHKGSIYYFWGMTVVQRGEFDRGYLLMHQAFQEDVLTSEEEFPDTPAYAFVSLDYGKVDQAFRQWVQQQADYLSLRISDYNEGRDKSFTLDELRGKFLKSPPHVDTVYLLAYTVANILSLDSLPNHYLASPFAGQLILNILFDLIQIIDVSIAEKTGKWKMIDQIESLSTAAGCEITNDKLGNLNAELRDNFKETLCLLLDGNYKFQDGTSPSQIQTDLLIAYGLRNRGAHNISSVSTIWERFPELREAVFNTLFLTVETLY
jgi:hypothetical protein